jgi:hypothetical protein
MIPGAFALTGKGAAQKSSFEREKKRVLGLHSTILTQFSLPNSFGTQSQQEGSFAQLPSTRKRYSYLPGLRDTVAFHIPVLSFFIRFALVSQLLKSPTRKISRASGAGNSNGTFLITTSVLALVGRALLFTAISIPPCDKFNLLHLHLIEIMPVSK